MLQHFIIIMAKFSLSLHTFEMDIQYILSLYNLPVRLSY